MKLSVRIRRRKWHVTDPLRDFRECPECAAVVQGWDGQWRHKEWHEASAGEPDEWQDPGGIIYGGAMAPADVPEYHHEQFQDDDSDDTERSYWDD